MKAPYVSESNSGGDVEMGESAEVQLKRDLGARHINMIAIAGMIVSQISDPKMVLETNKC